MNAVDAPPWESVSHDVRCPLCEYNLRGLTEPRWVRAIEIRPVGYRQP